MILKRNVSIIPPRKPVVAIVAPTLIKTFPSVSTTIIPKMKWSVFGESINIGSGRPRQIRKIIEYIKKVSKGGSPQFGKIKLRKDEILKLYPNIKKAKNKINWKPKIPFDKGPKSTIKFYNEQAT